MKITLTYNPRFRMVPTRPPKAAWELRTQDGDADPVYVKAYPVEYEANRRVISADVLDDLALLQYASANTIEIKRGA